jgi:hypothetical protein
MLCIQPSKIITIRHVALIATTYETQIHMLIITVTTLVLGLVMGRMSDLIGAAETQSSSTSTSVLFFGYSHSLETSGSFNIALVIIVIINRVTVTRVGRGCCRCEPLYTRRRTSYGSPRVIAVKVLEFAIE